MRFYQYHPEGEIKPFQRVVSQNARGGIGRLEPLGKMEEFCDMIRAQDNHPSRSDLQLLRSVSVQWRAERLPEPGRPAQEMSVEQTTFCTDLQRASGASTRRWWPNGRNPRPANLGEAGQPHFFTIWTKSNCVNRRCKKESWGHIRISEDPRPAGLGEAGRPHFVAPQVALSRGV